MNAKIRNLAHVIHSENDEHKLYKMLFSERKYVADNIQELLELLGISYIGRTFCVLNEKDIKFVCMNTHNPLLMKYVPKEYCADILKLFKDITPRFELMKMYIQSYGCMKDESLRKRIFDIIVKNFTPSLIIELDYNATGILTDDEFLTLYNKYGKAIKRECNISDMANLCFRFERLFSDIDSKLFYRELIKNDSLLKQASDCYYKNLKENTYNKIQAWLVLNSIRQEVI